MLHIGERSLNQHTKAFELLPTPMVASRGNFTFQGGNNGGSFNRGRNTRGNGRGHFPTSSEGNSHRANSLRPILEIIKIVFFPPLFAALFVKFITSLDTMLLIVTI